MRTCKKVSDVAASASATTGAATAAAAAASPSRRHSGSHSRAERARRQRIKQRMQHLQNLVPGCKNMTGRAALDKIISYVVSLQHQIEVLSIMLSQASQEAIDAERVRVSEVENPEMWLPVSDSLMGSSVSPSSAFYF